ncbi:MAG TPA: histidine triad nucleotide-binding protein [Burkholderiaceae bacterium]|nr:histidine triad nucleotide-binding protein [Burkholderiaceae bacterium]
MSHTDPDCIFCKIVAGQIPSKKAFENDEFFAFHDIRPAAPVHLLVIPKRHVPSLLEVQPGDEEMLGRLLALVPRLARDNGLGNGFKTAINTGSDGGQEVYHLHLHVFGGPRPWRTP